MDLLFPQTVYFVDHSDLPMDNNETKHMLHPMVLARNNYLGNHFLWAGFLSTAMFSIILICLMNKLSLRASLAFSFNQYLKRNASPAENKLNLLFLHNLYKQTKTMLQTYR